MDDLRGRILLLCLVSIIVSASAVSSQSGDTVNSVPVGCDGNQLDPMTGFLKGGEIGSFSGHDCDGAPRGCIAVED